MMLNCGANLNIKNEKKLNIWTHIERMEKEITSKY
jgi:hypothetical protein